MSRDDKTTARRRELFELRSVQVGSKPTVNAGIHAVDKVVVPYGAADRLAPNPP